MSEEQVQDTKQDKGQDASQQDTQAKTFPEEYVKELRDENAKRRVEARELKDELGKMQEAFTSLQASLAKGAEKPPEKPDDVVQRVQEMAQVADTLTKKMQDLESRGQQNAVRQAVIIEAAKAGINDPEDAYKLADLNDVSVGDDGTVTGAADAIAKLVEAKPYLLKNERSKPANPGPTNPGGGSGSSSPPQWIVDRFRPSADASIGDGGIVYHDKE